MDWVHLYKQSVTRYEMNTLLSCLETDGEKVLSDVLKELGLTTALQLVKDAKRRE